MKKLRSSLFALGVLVPFLAFGAIGDSLRSDQDAVAPIGTASQVCCPIYFMGKWYCIPCG